MIFIYFLQSFFFLNWSIIALYCCVSFCCKTKWIDYVVKSVKVLVAHSCLTLFHPLTVAARLPCPWNSAPKNTRVSCHSLLQGIFMTHRLNLPCRQILYHLSLYTYIPSLLSLSPIPLSHSSTSSQSTRLSSLWYTAASC